MARQDDNTAAKDRDDDDALAAQPGGIVIAKVTARDAYVAYRGQHLVASIVGDSDGWSVFIPQTADEPKVVLRSAASARAFVLGYFTGADETSLARTR